MPSDMIGHKDSVGISSPQTSGVKVVTPKPESSDNTGNVVSDDSYKETQPVPMLAHQEYFKNQKKSGLKGPPGGDCFSPQAISEREIISFDETDSDESESESGSSDYESGEDEQEQMSQMSSRSDNDHIQTENTPRVGIMMDMDKIKMNKAEALVVPAQKRYTQQPIMIKESANPRADDSESESSQRMPES